MRNLFLLLGLFFTVESFAAQSSATVINSLSWGVGQAGAAQAVDPILVTDSTNSQGWFVLTVQQTNTAHHYRPWYKQGVKYQVPGGKTAKCVSFFGFTTAANSSYQLVYDTVAIADDQNNSSLTAGVFQSGADFSYIYTMYSLVWTQYSITFDFPQNTYPALQASNADSSGKMLLCREI